MNIHAIQQDLSKNINSKVKISEEDKNRYRIFTPFMFEDGDHLSIILKNENGVWILTDEGHTLMHLADDFNTKDMTRESRKQIVVDALSEFSVQDKEGELIAMVQEDQYGIALSNLIHAILKIAQISHGVLA